MGEGRVLGCFCARLLVRSFRGVCWGWLTTHLRRQNSPHLRKRCRQCAPMHLLDGEEAMSKTLLARAKLNSLAHAPLPTLRLTCAHRHVATLEWHLSSSKFDLRVAHKGLLCWSGAVLVRRVPHKRCATFGVAWDPFLPSGGSQKV